MGWWGEGVMDGDSPRQVFDRWDRAFGRRQVTPEQALQFIEGVNREWGGIDSEIIDQTVAMIMTVGRMPLSEPLKQRFYQAIERDQSELWSEPGKRRDILSQLRKAIEAMPVVHVPDRLDDLTREWNAAAARGLRGAIESAFRGLENAPIDDQIEFLLRMGKTREDIAGIIESHTESLDMDELSPVSGADQHAPSQHF